MKNIFKNIWNFIVAVRTAAYAADLARNGKISQAQSYYR